MIDVPMGNPRTAAELLRSDMAGLVEDWRRACGTDALVHGSASSQEADELTADRARAVVAATGAAVVGALAEIIDTAAESQRPGPSVSRVADILAERNVAIGQLVRQLSLLRQVLHSHVSSRLPSALAGEAEQQLDLALDTLMEVCASRAALRLEQDAFVDPLTGLLNRRALDRDLPREMAVAERHGRRLSLLTADLDGLKRINDSHGHAMGDEALRGLGGAMRAALRAGDSAYRVGGDEFVVLLPEMGPEDASSFVTRVGDSSPPAFSWGAATFPDEAADGPSLLALADQRLLGSREGRGRGPARAMTAVAATDRDRTVKAPRAGRRRSMLMATFLGGVLLGGGGLASAATGTLPPPVQDMAHTVLRKVGVPVPPARAKSDRAAVPSVTRPDPPPPAPELPPAEVAPVPSVPSGHDLLIALPPPGAGEDGGLSQDDPKAPSPRGARDAPAADPRAPAGRGGPAPAGPTTTTSPPAGTSTTSTSTTSTTTTTTTTTTVPPEEGTAEASTGPGTGSGHGTERRPSTPPGGDKGGGGGGDKDGGGPKPKDG